MYAHVYVHTLLLMKRCVLYAMYAILYAISVPRIYDIYSYMYTYIAYSVAYTLFTLYCMRDTYSIQYGDTYSIRICIYAIAFVYAYTRDTYIAIQYSDTYSIRICDTYIAFVYATHI